MISVPSSAPVAIPTESSICTVCFDDLYRTENPEFAGKHVAIVRPCGHKFHLHCLTRWTKDHLTCPIGRGAIEDMVVKNLTLPRGWQQQMVKAAKEGDIGIIRALLNRGADVDAGQTAELTPLAWAATNKHLEVALLLASRGGSDPHSLCKLGDLFQEGGKGFPANPFRAKVWFLKAARLGNALAMKNLKKLSRKRWFDEAFPNESRHTRPEGEYTATCGKMMVARSLSENRLPYCGGSKLV